MWPYRLVNLRLFVGDARDVAAGLAVFGQRNPLRAWLESHGCGFGPANLGRGRGTACFCSPGEPWQHAVGVKARLGHVSSTRISDDLSDVLGWALRRWPVDEVVLVPLSWREPETVAFNMLLALWLLSFNPKQTVGQERLDTTFTIASADSVEPFLYWLRDDCREMRDRVTRLLRPYRDFALTRGAVTKFERIGFALTSGAA